MSFIAGSYSCLWNSLSLGQMEDGYRIIEPGTGESDDIRGDTFGQGSDQDAVLLGGNCFVEMTLLEYNAAALRTLLSKDAVSGRAFIPGTLVSTLWASLVLTRIGSGSVVTATPATRTFARAHLARPADVAYGFQNRLRRLPLRFQIFPQVSSSEIVYWVDS